VAERAALELEGRLIDAYEGKSLERFFKDLRSEIDADQRALQDLLEKLGEKESPVRKARLVDGREVLPREDSTERFPRGPNGPLPCPPRSRSQRKLQLVREPE
jgi:hypothetical protein